MEASEELDDRVINFNTQLKKYVKTEDEITALMLTYLGIISNLLDFLTETYDGKRVKELPELIKYTMVQAIAHFNFIVKMNRNELETKDFEFKHFPVEDDGWVTPEKISDRYITVIKDLYQQLQEEGRL